jgi:Haem-binding domain
VPSSDPTSVPAGSGSPGRRRWKRWLAWAALGLVILLGLIQLIPYGHEKNPPVTKAAVWSNPQAQGLAESGCYDCHSNLTKQWWATKIAPASWLAQSDVDGGRNALNFSEWDKPQSEASDAIEVVQSGSMPPLQYKLFHSDARLSDVERQQLADGLKQLYATDPPAGIKQGGG